MTAVPAQAIPIAVVNENSKYAGSVAVKKAGPPPARKMAGAIDVIGGGNLSSRRPESGVSPSSPPIEEPAEVVSVSKLSGLPFAFNHLSNSIILDGSCACRETSRLNRFFAASPWLPEHGFTASVRHATTCYSTSNDDGSSANRS